MNRNEALRVLGLDEDATPEEVKAAYKEMAQILHPDRFASNKKLQDRATEQFKNLQEAYDLLTSGPASAKAAGKAGPGRGGAARNPTAREYEARMAGLAAARAQLVAQRDTLLDERRNALIFLGIGAVLCVFLHNYTVVVALGSTAVIWGIVRTANIQSTLRTLDEHIRQIAQEQKQAGMRADDLEG